MNESIIEQIMSGKSLAQQMSGEEYKNLLDEFVRGQADFKDRLGNNLELIEMYEGLIDIMGTLEILATIDSYKKGFKTGIFLGLEVGSA